MDMPNGDGLAGKNHHPRKMKRLLIIAMLCLLSASVWAEEYRYSVMATTGVPERIFEGNGKETLIRFTGDSDPQARFMLRKILDLGGINGTKGRDEWRGVPFEQAIIVVGKLLPAVIATPSGPAYAPAVAYQEFKLENVLIRFPLVRHREGKVFDTGYLETHFSYDTLFPDGLEFGGKPIDWEKHTAKNK